MFLDIPQSLAEPLEVDDLPLAQETDGIADFRILHDAEYVVVSGAGFLLRGQILEKVGYGIAL